MNVLLVPNNEGWAFANRAQDLMRLECRKVKFAAKVLSQVTPKDTDKYDLIYPMSITIGRDLAKKGIPMEKMATGITSVRVFEKYRTGRKGFNKEFLSFLGRFRGINAWSDEIVTIFRPYLPIVKTRIGIYEDVFKPDAKKNHNPVFTVGWVGRIDTPAYRKHKGYDIILAALKDLNVALDIRTYKENYVPRNEMAGFYQKLDCFVCSSVSEGLPNPVLEAAACGVPVLSTKVGFVPELIRPGYNGLIVPGTPEAIRHSVLFLKNNPATRLQMGHRMRQTVLDNWTWSKCGKDWENFFTGMKG